MNRLDACFARLKVEGRKAFVTYTMAGDPDRLASLNILHALAEHADILEIGMPFSDPMADGPVIQAAGNRALAQNVKLNCVLDIVQQFRSKNSTMPIVLMGYYNPILKYGIDKFISKCRELGIDGLIIADMPPEQGHEIAQNVQQNNVHLIRFLTPTTTPARLATITQDASGFLYYVSIAGVTGSASADPDKVAKHIAELRNGTNMPIIVGFGIKTPDDVRAMATTADGVVVGSALVQTIADNINAPNLLEKVSTQAAALAAPLNGK